jgi:uncharacterized protein YjbI with pentapeptide repeats
MSEQDGTHSSLKQRRSRKVNTANKENGKQAPATQHPAKDDREAWKAYWKAQGLSWRTEPEIDVERQKYLEERRSINPDIEQGIYPFRDIKLNRADVEWLLATHENGRGPIKWNDEQRRERDGLDICGAILCGVDLSRLPLTKLRAGLNRNQWMAATKDQRKASTVHLEKANLLEAHLEGASLRGAHLEGTNMKQARLEYAYFTEACLAGTSLRGAHLEGTKLSKTYLGGKVMSKDELEYVRVWVKDFPEVLSPADLRLAYFNATSEPVDTILGEAKHYSVSLADVRWGGVNLAMINWSVVKVLGDEHEARQKKVLKGEGKTQSARIREFLRAVRANRQLAVVLQTQGLNEDAARFAYRAQLLQRKVVWYERKFGQYLFSLLLDLLSGYGYKPWRSFIAYLIVIAAFATAYFIIGRSVGPALSPLGAWVFSMTSFHGRGFFPGGIGLDDPLTVLAAIEAFVGLLIEVTFIATLTQRLFGK